MNINDKGHLIKSIAFEKAVFKVLEMHNPKLKINSEEYYNNKEFSNEKIIHFKRYDGYIENELNLSVFDMGIIQAEKIIIEVKFLRVHNGTILRLLHEFSNILNDENSVFVFICSGNIPDDFLEKLNAKCRVVVVDRNILIKNIIIKKVLKSFDEYIVEENNVLIDDYYPLLRNMNNISFALGAGCSKDSNISDWNTLSKALGFELLYNIVYDKESIYKTMHITNTLNDKIFSCYDKNSALDAIYQNYISLSSVNQLDYYSAIKNVLYMSYDNPSDANTKLMTAINKCITRRNITEIINYNFDSVLEQNYDNKYKSKKNEILTSTTRIGNCDVYHVHGYIPHDYDGKTSVKNFIFTDKEYYENSINGYSFCNTIQNRILSMYNVVFVGVSFTDSNMKAMLWERLSNSPKTSIFAFLKLPKFQGNGTEIKRMENKYKLLQQTYFDSLGVKILWVKEHTDTPNEIDKI